MRDATFGYLAETDLGLFTDLYELTMMQGYHERDHNPEATFSLFFRDLPENRGYLVAAGLEQAVHYLERFSFDAAARAFLREQGFEEEFLDRLGSLEFTGEVRAVPEGTLVFPNEPLVEVTAPILEAQLFETMLLNQLGFQSLVATKAARMRDVIDRHGDDQSLVGFGSRRAHGTDAGMKAARGVYVGGFDGTSNVAAGEAFDIPVFGTMAHSWVQSFASERDAFRAFVETHGEDAILLVDTYDTVEGAKLAVDVADEMGVDVRGVRLDSGDLAALSKEVDPIVGDVGIFVSSGVDEYKLRDFFDAGGVATGFGPGTSLATSADAPKLDIVYKLVAVERDGALRPTMKLSAGKVTYPSGKQVRRVERDGRYAYDVLGLRDEDGEGQDLLVTVFDDGERVSELPSLDEVRERRAAELAKLPEPYRAVTDPAAYEVRVSERLQARTDDLRRRLEAGER